MVGHLPFLFNTSNNNNRRRHQYMHNLHANQVPRSLLFAVSHLEMMCILCLVAILEALAQPNHR